MATPGIDRILDSTKGRGSTALPASVNPTSLAAIQYRMAQVSAEANAAASAAARFSAALSGQALQSQLAALAALEGATRRQNLMLRERLTLEARRQAVSTGQYAKELQALRLINQERARVEQMERRAGYTARFGRFGGAMYHLDALRNSGAIRGGMAVAGAAGAAATGLAMRGFSGTVEFNRLNLEVQMVSREMAGAMLPALKLTTRAIQGFRRFLEGVGPGGQNALMLGGLALGGLGTAMVARAGLGGLGGVLGMASGGMAAGRAAGAGLALPLALGAAAGASGFRYEATGLAAGFGAARGGIMGTGAARGAARAAAPIAVGAIGYEAATGGYYSELRARGHSRFVAGLGSVGGGFMDFLSGGAYGEEFRKRSGSGVGPWSSATALAAATGGGATARRMVTIADAGFDSPGSAFERIANRLSLVDAGGEPEKDTLGEIRDIIRDAVKHFTTPTPPRLP